MKIKNYKPGWIDYHICPLCDVSIIESFKDCENCKVFELIDSDEVEKINVDNIILLDSEEAKIFGFTSDKFSKNSYLWKNNNEIIISFIVSIHEHHGNLLNLFLTIRNQGYNIFVPTPFPRMRSICCKFGMISQDRFGEAEGMFYDTLGKNS